MSDTASLTGESEATFQVVEFTLGSETYCVSIDRIAELVDMQELTTIPNSPAHVRGVMDLRGKTTSVVDPKVVLGLDEDGPEERVIVFGDGEGNQGDVGWIVDEVTEVIAFTQDQIDTSSGDQSEHIIGIIKADDGFRVWLDPDAINAY